MYRLQKSIILLMATLLACQSAPDSSTNEKSTTSSWEAHQARVYTTADSSTLRLSPYDTLTFEHHGQPVETEVTIFLNPGKKFQTMLGIGGALTDAAAETFARLTPDKQEQVLNAYFDPTSGIGYTLARTNINSCDFSSGSYTYVEANDSLLTTFDIAHDQQYKIPLIKRAQEKVNNQLTLFASPWSPPAWMKDNQDMLHGGKLVPRHYPHWANYFVKFIQAYEAHGIPVWGLSVQNEPMARQIWESCIFTAEEERDFIKKFLGPTLQKNGLGGKKIIAWDHNRDLIYQRAQLLLDDPEAASYIWGIGFHWYEDWSGGKPMYDNVNLVHEAWPDKKLFFTEGCNGKFNDTRYDDWSLGERYGESMIHDFNAGTVGWTDWNILLDEHGGPNHVGNFCFAPIHGNTATNELIFTNSYYYIGHFSKFIRPGAQRIHASSSRSNLLTTAFQNTDGSLAAVVMNPTDKKVTYQVWINNQTVTTISLPHSISTIIIQ